MSKSVHVAATQHSLIPKVEIFRSSKENRLRWTFLSGRWISSNSILMIKGDFDARQMKDMNTSLSFQTYENGLIPPSNISCQKLQPAIDPTASRVRIIEDSEGRRVEGKVRRKTQCGGINVHIKTGFYASEKALEGKSN